jgi:uncharacterized protein YjbI with pentapeptide repeats
MVKPGTTISKAIIITPIRPQTKGGLVNICFLLVTPQSIAPGHREVNEVPARYFNAMIVWYFYASTFLSEKNRRPAVINEDMHSFEGVVFTESDLGDKSFEDAVFTDCRFADITLAGTIFISCEFNRCEFVLARLENCSLNGTLFKECKIMGIDFSKCSDFAFSPEFNGCLIKNCAFIDKDLRKTRVSGCRLIESDLFGCDFREADFSGTSFEDVTIRESDFRKADFRSARGYSIDPSGNRIAKARFSLPEAESFLLFLDICLEE